MLPFQNNVSKIGYDQNRMLPFPNAECVQLVFATDISTIWDHSRWFKSSNLINVDLRCGRVDVRCVGLRLVLSQDLCHP
jgi:hypothetical protein